VPARAAFELWLTDNIRHAKLHRATGADGAFKVFTEQHMDALAGLRAGLGKDAERLPGSRILDGQFAAVQQAIGVRKGRSAGAAFLREFVEDAKKSGFVGELIKRFGVVGRLGVAPLAQG